MHILLIHQAFVALDEPGGTRHHELARHLVQHGHRVTVIASPVSYLTGKTSREGHSHERMRPSWLHRQVDEWGVTILRAYNYPALHRSFVHRVFSFLSFMVSSFLAGLSVKEVDLVWGTSPPIFQGATAWLLARLKRVPLLFEVRDLWPAFAIEVGVLRNPLLIRASEWLERFLYRQADQVVVNSPGFLEHVQTRGAQRVSLVPNGTDPQMFAPGAERGSLRGEHGLEDAFVILYAGAHGLSNDLELVLEAADRTRGRTGLRYVFVGDGKEKPALVQHARRLDLTNVLFLPPVAKQEMKHVLAAADVCLAILKPIPLYRTVFPNKVFDYMAAGKPVLLAIDGVIKQVVEQAGAGICVPPGNAAALADAAQRFADDPQEAIRMGRRGRDFVAERYNRAAIAAQFAHLVESMVEKR